MEKNFHKTFSTCPVCGSTDRFLEQLGDELKECGLARPEWRMALDIKLGPVIDQGRPPPLVGSKIPGFGITTDICMNCGCVYAIDITRLEFTQNVELPKGPMRNTPFDRMPQNNPRLS